MSLAKIGKQTGLFAPADLAFNSLLSVYRCQAKKRGLPFELTEAEFKHFTRQPCAVCGAPPYQAQRTRNRLGVYIYTGLDRIDNAKGYSLANVQPCCGPCNRAKADMSLQALKTWLARLKSKVGQWNPAQLDLPEGLPLNAAGRALLNRYVQSARKKEKVFEISESVFSALVAQPCFYCGTVPCRALRYGKSVFISNGIDRLDCAIGYVQTNAVPACWPCNNAKGLQSAEEFSGWVLRCCANLCI